MFATNRKRLATSCTAAVSVITMFVLFALLQLLPTGWHLQPRQLSLQLWQVVRMLAQ